VRISIGLVILRNPIRIPQLPFRNAQSAGVLPMRALILTDIQNDFLPGGALAVPDGDQVIPIANTLQPHFEIVVATQDWHPANHGSFAANHPGKSVGDIIELNGLPQILWPVHCVQNTHGAAFSKDLNTRQVQKIIRKGMDPQIDSYSGFFDNGRRKDTGLAEFLRKRGADEIYLVGLTTDYCVRFSALDAAGLGFRTNLIVDGCRGVELKPGDVERAIDEIRQKGIAILHADEVIA
jgi:nicotinamidase/pyrazinamidase